MQRRIVLIGAGPASLMAASKLDEGHSITIIEKPSRNFLLGKRILVSGNGRANFFNEDLLSKKGAKEMLAFLHERLGFSYAQEGKLYYPFFNRSECLQQAFVQYLSKRNDVSIVKATCLKVDPNGKSVLIKEEDGRQKKVIYDCLIFAPGGRSYDRDDFSYGLLDSLGVRYLPFESVLCPVKTMEKIPDYLARQRLKGHLSLFLDGKHLYEEDGEILFKDDGISGICVFDSTLFIRKNQNKGKRFVFRFDYTRRNGTVLSEKDLETAPYFLRRYLKERGIAPLEPLEFTYKEMYSFKDSQISYGGILEEERYEDLSLKKHPDIYPLGETMNRNFICGGYNMGNALLEGYLAAKEIDRNE